MMRALYDFDAPKKATNLSINSDLLKKTRALNINLSATLEQVLQDKLKTIEAEKWQKENKKIKNGNMLQKIDRYVLGMIFVLVWAVFTVWETLT